MIEHGTPENIHAPWDLYERLERIEAYIRDLKDFISRIDVNSLYMYKPLPFAHGADDFLLIRYEGHLLVDNNNATYLSGAPQWPAIYFTPLVGTVLPSRIPNVLSDVILGDLTYVDPIDYPLYVGCVYITADFKKLLMKTCPESLEKCEREAQ